MTVLVDSWAWIEYFKGSRAGEKAREVIEGDEEVIVSTINIAEVYRWILLYYNEDIAEEKRLAIRTRCFVVDVTEEIALEAAKIKHKLKWGLGDAIVYATARKERAKVLTGDPDFKGFDNVMFIED